ncbi:hypothetical protein GMORB2_2533 [Geosmithia morbida]|uniref:DUF6536 domain-containing protein n=1 Tax=Geosmithia morbida TaxID=1094350 RepID=A0A9P4YR49_9HYPO|nr:uncharacterized protein GMORB2_2533 [Geosmithia morbida]KAF4121047.1 hypothetical protein GMORB2_2533 [Geosmithia morbida]
MWEMMWETVSDSTVNSIPENPGESSSTSHRVTTSSSSRPTLGWPFQSHSHNRSISGSWARHSRSGSRSRSGSTPRRSSRLSSSRRSNGWMSLRPASSLVGDDVIPDYVINYIHGETPESLAKKRERAAAKIRTAEMHRGENIQSRAAELDHVNSQRDLEKGAGGALRRMMTGWKGGIILNLLLGAVVFIASVVCIGLAAARGRFAGQEAKVVVEGRCGRVSSLSAGLNALVNVLAVLMLAGANYTAQTLASPTRSEVAEAHARLGWMDIGIPSLRNLGGISRGRAALSVMAVMLAMGAQVVYNSLTFIAQTNSSTCSLYLNGPLLATVAGLYLLFMFTLAATVTLVGGSSTRLVTLGDAISSFLTDPDSTTEGACLVTKADIVSKRWGCGQARYWFTERHLWGQTPSPTRWAAWFATWVVPTGLTAAMVGMAVTDEPGKKAALLSSLTSTTATYDLPPGLGRVGACVVLALPHLLLAVLYLTTNALLSVYRLSHEFSQFSAPGVPQGLRVSSAAARGSQVSSLHLTLPLAWSSAAVVVFAGAGLMLGQSFRVVVAPGSDGERMAIGLNVLPLVILLAVLAATGAVVGLLSLRRAAPAADGRSSTPVSVDEEVARRRDGNPLALKGGSCSAVISARCHPSSAEGSGLASMPLVWGVVYEGEGGSGSKVGHAAFSSRPVGMLNVAKAYA